jgi:threonine/homoserine/homoserine lactone efflux protein
MAAVGNAFGFTRGIPYLTGCATGLILVMVVAALGLAHLVDLYPGTVLIVSIIGVSYILYLAYKIARETSDIATYAEGTSPGFFAGVLVSLSNPKGWAVMGALFLSMGSVQSMMSMEMMIRFIILCVIIVFGNLAWTLLGDRLSKLIADPRKGKILNRIFAFLLVASVIWALLL